jgi:ParB family chromosome partitioning protein
LSSYEDIFKSEGSETDKVISVRLEELHEYEGHPFNVYDDESMTELAESIGQSGVMVPGVARPREKGGYEILAGHRRRRACELAGLGEMPVIVRELDDCDAAILMADSNLQRPEILPSEKAYAYKIKLDAVKKRTELRISAGKANETKKKSGELLAEQSSESKNQIYRYIRLTELVRDLLTLVDAKKLTLSAAVELSYLSKDGQEILAGLLNEGIGAPSLSQAQKIREAGEEEGFGRETIEDILTGDTVREKPLSLGTGKLKKYFPPEYTRGQMEDVILELLERWSRESE